MIDVWIALGFAFIAAAALGVAGYFRDHAKCAAKDAAAAAEKAKKALEAANIAKTAAGCSENEKRKVMSEVVRLRDQLECAGSRADYWEQIAKAMSPGAFREDIHERPN